MTSLRIGVLADAPGKQQYLHQVVEQVGHQLVYSTLLQNANAQALEDTGLGIQAWIVDVEDGDGAEEELTLAGVAEASDVLLNRLLEVATVPVILSASSEYAEGTEAHKAWLRRMALRLQRLSGDINLQRTSRATSLWVLAASTGGPAAVKEFLSHLPPELGVAFVYVQHIDAGHGATLVKMMSGAGHYPASLSCQGAVLQRDALVLVTADQRVDIQDNGTLLHSSLGWGGQYAPSVDQVAANVARVYGERSGLIVFTGMGDDGAAGGRMIRQRGGQVWTQSLETCTSDSMPAAAVASGCTSFSGSPVELAEKLVNFLSGRSLTQGDKLHRKALP